MNLNATLLGEMITFGIFIWFTLRYVWPFIMKAMQEREKTIANGLAAAEKGVQELEDAHRKTAEMLHKARLDAAELIEKAHQRAADMIESAKAQAREEGSRLIELAKGDIAQEREAARHELQRQVSQIAMTAVSKFLGTGVDVRQQQVALDKFITTLSMKEAS